MNGLYRRLFSFFLFVAVTIFVSCDPADSPQTKDSSEFAVQSPDKVPEDEPVLSVRFPEAVTAEGSILVFSGIIKGTDGKPISEARMEIWQTDFQGIYDHPGDPETMDRDPGFQFFGSHRTDPDGSYVFRTVVPGQYEPRPQHIHFKVYSGDTELLTSQIYFAEAGESTGTAPESLTMTMVPSEESMDAADLTGIFDIVLKTGSDTEGLQLTPSQTEGPYYPAVSVAEYDNDLAGIDNSG